MQRKKGEEGKVVHTAKESKPERVIPMGNEDSQEREILFLKSPIILNLAGFLQYEEIGWMRTI